MLIDPEVKYGIDKVRLLFIKAFDPNKWLNPINKKRLLSIT